MAATLAINKTILPNHLDATQQFFKAYGTITLSGNYGGASTNGDTLDLSPLNIPGTAVVSVFVWEAPPAGTAPTGYFFTFCPGTTINNGVLYISQCAGSAAPASQITEGNAYPAALTGTTYIYCEVTITKFQ